MSNGNAQSDRLLSGRRLAGGFLWTAGGRLIAIAALLVTNAILARRLPKVEFGAWLLLTQIVYFASLVAMCGVNRTAVRFMAEAIGDQRFDRVKSIVRQSTRLLVPATAIAGIGLGIALILGGERILHVRLTAAAILLAVGLSALTAMQQLLGESLRGFHDLRSASLFTGTNGGPISNLLMLSVVTAVTAYTSVSLSTALGCALLAVSLAIVPGALLLRSRLRRLPASEVAALSTNESAKEAEQFARTSFTLLLVQMLAFATINCDLAVVGLCCTGEDMTWYNVARRLIAPVVMPLQFVNLTLLSVIPALYRQRRLSELEQLIRLASTASGFAGTVLFLPLLLFPENALALVFGPGYESAAMPLVILTVANLVNLWTGSCGITLMMTGHEKLAAGINAIALVIHLVADPIAAKYWGIEGLAISAGTIVALQNVAAWWLARRHVGVWTHPDLSIARMRTAVQSLIAGRALVRAEVSEARS